MKIARVVISSAAFCAVDIVRGGNRLINGKTGWFGLVGPCWVQYVESTVFIRGLLTVLRNVI